MAGRMGGDRTTVLGLKVVQIDVANNLVVVRGSVPGSDNAVSVKP
jgi:large subunit ribosomal protein L3